MTGRPVAILILGLALAACGGNEIEKSERRETIQVVQGSPTPKASPTTPPGNCWEIGLTNVVGQAYSPAVAEQARQASKAEGLQVVRDGQTANPNRTGDRITLKLNAKETIVEAYCG